MNKKIVMSLAVIAAATAVMAGGTIAYFSDTEESTGNTFTAGNIDLKIDSQCHYGSGNCPDADSTWALTDLEAGVHKFFNFDDIKPGSWGENTISLHVDDNPAWAWMKIDAVQNLENGCNEPEGKVDATCGTPGNGEGELADNLHYLVWQDTYDGGGVHACNNQLDAGEHIFKTNEAISTCEVIKLSKGCGPTGCGDYVPLDPDTTYCVGVSWCAGNWVVNSGGGYDCDGLAIGNEAQGDSLNLDVEFAVIQSMNNPNGDGGPTCQ